MSATENTAKDGCIKILSRAGRQAKRTAIQVITSFLHSITPYHSLNHLKRYFSTCRAIAEHRAETLLHFRLFFLALTYWAVLHLALYRFGDQLSTATRIALIDLPFILRIEHYHELYVFLFGLNAFSIYLHWALYFRGSRCTLPFIEEEALFGKSTVGKHFSSADRINTIHRLDSLKFQRWTLLVTNLMEIFTIFLDTCMAFFMVLIWIRAKGAVENCSECQIATSSSSQLLLTYLSVMVVHLFLYFLFWTSFEQTFAHLATLGLVTMIHLNLTFRQNYKELGKKLQKCKPFYGASVHCRCYQPLHRQFKFFCLLFIVLQRNIHLFELVFAVDVFNGQLYLIYLACHLPTSAWFFMQIAFGKVDSGLLIFIFSGLLFETFYGVVVVHLCIARIRNWAHCAGKLLVAYPPKAEIGKTTKNGTTKSLPPKVAIQLSHHINRLYVKNMHGITYGAIGSGICMKSFVKCLLIYSECLMYAYTLVKK